MDLPVLIVGAGPTGLNLALGLARRGVAFRLISDSSGPGEHSRAMAVQARTLEFYDQFAFAKEVVESGVIVEEAHIRQSGSDDVTTVRFRDLGDGISPFPFALAYPQDDHERFLTAKLQELGVPVEWRTKLTGFTEANGEITAGIVRDGHAEEMRASYICGCDGAHSAVRESLRIGFPGGTYEQLFYVADVRIAGGFNRNMNVSIGEHILTLMFPVRSSGMQRLIGLVPAELSSRTDLTFDEIRGYAEKLLEIQVTEVNWFSTYRVHHRVADRFRIGRAFLLGDAGHIHSPAGGQGMNTGIGDAVNLGWKLAHVIQGRAKPILLDSYEPERIAFARLLVATTDRAFTPLVGSGIGGELARRVIAPLLIAVATRVAPARHAFFRVISQARIHYPESPLSAGQAGHVHGGDRLPWLGAGGEDNFAPLRSLDWQMHVYGTVSDALQTACMEQGLPLHKFRWDERAAHAGFAKDAACLVRPDGYVGLALATQDAGELREYLQRIGTIR